MDNRNKYAKYIASKALQAIFQEDDFEFKDSDVSSEEGDCIFKCSDYSDIESLKQSSSDPNKKSILSVCDGEDHSSGVSVKGKHNNHIIERDQTMVVEADASVNDQTQDILVGKKGTIWQKQSPVTGRHRTQDTIVRQAPLIPSAVNCTSAKQVFNFFNAQLIINLVVVDTNREARRKTDK